MRLLIVPFMLIAWTLPGPARADNAMGYRLLSAQEAAGLPNNHGSLGMAIERSQAIISGGMTFDIIRVKQVQRGSPGDRAGFRPGDNIIAVDGRVFPTLASFGAYVGSKPPGTQASVDYIPSGSSPSQAQRVMVVVGTPGAPAPTGTAEESGKTSGGLSTRSKVAIGVGAAAVLGCYEMGCFSHRGSGQQPAQAAQPSGQNPR